MEKPHALLLTDIFKLQKEVLKFNKICVSVSSAKADLDTNFLEGLNMRPEIKYTPNQILFRHEKDPVYCTLLFNADKIKCNFISRLVAVKQPITKCKQIRTRYKDKHVRGNNSGIHCRIFTLNQHSN